MRLLAKHNKLVTESILLDFSPVGARFVDKYTVKVTKINGIHD
jgi:hypothetical protein